MKGVIFKICSRHFWFEMSTTNSPHFWNVRLVFIKPFEGPEKRVGNIFALISTSKQLLQKVMQHSLGNSKDVWVKVFKNGPSKVCGRQPWKNLKRCGRPLQILHFIWSSTNFTWFIFEHLDPYYPQKDFSISDQKEVIVVRFLTTVP